MPWKAQIPEWAHWDNILIALAFLGLLVWRGVGFLKGVKTIEDLFKRKETISETQERHDREIAELKRHVNECNEKHQALLEQNHQLLLQNSDMQIVLGAIDELLEDADVNEIDTLPTYVVQALIRALRRYRNNGK